MLIPAGRVLVTYLVCQRQVITYETKFDPELRSKGFDCIEFNHKNMLKYKWAGIRWESGKYSEWISLNIHMAGITPSTEKVPSIAIASS